VAAGGVFAGGVFAFLQNVNLFQGAALLRAAIVAALRHVAGNIWVGSLLRHRGSSLLFF
jgi:hypothetical protein